MLFGDMFDGFPDHLDFTPKPPVKKIGAVAPAWIKEPVEETKIEVSSDLKKAFGIELAKGLKPFDAACIICGQDTKQALIISQSWLNDPEVEASKNLYLKAAETSNALLDKEQLAARLLKMAEEKSANGAFYILDGKDRLKALELYAEVRGYTGKLAVDASTKTFNHTQMVIKFVKPEVKEKEPPVTIENETNNSNIKSPLKLKLVSAG